VSGGYAPARTWALTTTAAEACQRVDRFAGIHDLAVKWWPDRSRATVRGPDQRGWRESLLRLEVRETATGSELRVRAVVRTWLLAAVPALGVWWMFFWLAHVEGVAGPLAPALVGMFLLFAAIPGLAYRGERRRRARDLEHLEEQLAGVIASAPPPALGPYR
jgi:hypothetical protein